jgi:hypothetical protein
MHLPLFQNWLRASLKWLVISLLFALSVVSCTINKPSFPVAIFPKELPKIPEPDAAAAQVPAGYKVEVFMKDLIWPSSIDLDESGNVYVSEAGYVYGDPSAPTQILRITPSGQITRYAEGFNGPITNILWHKGQLYVSHRGKISKGIRPLYAKTKALRVVEATLGKIK